MLPLFVSISKEVHDQGLNLWKNCFLGQFYGLSPRIGHIQAVANRLWDRNDHGEVMSMKNGRYLCKFENLHINLGSRKWPMVCCPDSHAQINGNQVLK